MTQKGPSLFVIIYFIVIGVYGQKLSVSEISDNLKDLSPDKDSLIVKELLKESSYYLENEDVERESDLGKLSLALGDFYSKNFRYDSSMRYFQKAVDIYEQQTDTLQLAHAYYKLGGVHADIEDYPYSAEIYLKALDLYQKLEDQYHTGKTYNALANNYYYYGDTDVALNYYESAIDIFEDRMDTVDLSMTLGNAAATFSVEKKYDTAKVLYQRAIRLVKYAGYSDILIGNLIGLGIVLEESGKLDEAFYYYKRAYLESERTDNVRQKGFCFQNFAYYYLATDLIDSAEFYADLALSTSEKINNQQLRSNALEILHEVYYKKGQYKKAYDFLTTVRTELDSLYDLTSQRQLEAVHAQYQIDKKEKELEQANLQLRLNKNIIEREIIVRNSLIAVLFLMIVSISLIYRSQKIRSRSNQMLRQKNQEIEQKRREILEIEEAKSRWFVNISHELRTPLTLVKGPIDMLASYKNLDDSTRRSVQIAKRNVKLLENLVNEILDISKMEGGAVQLETEIFDIADFARQILFSFETTARVSRVDISFEYPLGDALYIKADKGKLLKAISNLISNAIKHTYEGGFVKLRLLENAKQIILEVADNGEGIHPSDLPHVFNRFYQAKHGSKSAKNGTGVGLALTREVAKLHGGNVMVDSAVNRGSTFRFILPSSIKVNLEPTIREDDSVTNEEVIIQPGKTNKKVLLVDDNPDMREYILSILNDYFEVRQARDGKDALHQLESFLPDLIVTDIMMPRMDGITLSRKIKESEQLKNIPIITLTALTDEKTKVETLRTGVDDYIVKPFNSEELLIRIDNLIHNAEERGDHSDEKGSTYEEKLMKKLEEEVLANLDNIDFNVNSLAESGNFSERQLYRYLKSTTGLTPANFVKEIRLQKAMELAKKKAYPTTIELAHAVGFQHSSYFINVFKKRFGISPSAILKD